MQYRLSTIFLIFFVVATSLAVFGTWGLLVSAIYLVMAFLLYLYRQRKIAFGEMIVIYFIILVLLGLSLPAFQPVRMVNPLPICTNNMKQLGLGLHNYHDAHKHFPPVIIRDKDGKPLYSWLVAILPNMEYDTIYNQLKTDEPWDSRHNAQVLGQLRIDELVCPGVRPARANPTNFLAVVGPGTFWRSDRALCLSDLQDKTATTVAAVESMTSDKHWAEPNILTVEEFLEQLEDGKKLKTSPAHPHEVHILFADGAVRGLSADMPVAMWRKLLTGQINDLKELDAWKPNPYAPLPANLFANHLPEAPGKWPFLLSILVWLISFVMLFRRAWKSRKISPEKPNIEADGGQ